MLNNAALLVFVAGTSDGLFWEIRRAFSLVSKSRILMLICRTEGLELFRRRMKQEIGVELPPIEFNASSAVPNGILAVVAFNERGTLTLHRPEPWKFRTIKDAWSGKPQVAPFEVQVEGFLFDALRPMLARHGIVHTDPRLPYLNATSKSTSAIWAYRIVITTFATFLTVLFGGLIYVSIFLSP